MSTGQFVAILADASDGGPVEIENGPEGGIRIWAGKSCVDLWEDHLTAVLKKFKEWSAKQ